MRTESQVRHIKGKDAKRAYISENTTQLLGKWLLYPDNLPGVGWVLEAPRINKNGELCSGNGFRRFYRFREDALMRYRELYQAAQCGQRGL